VHWPLNTFPAGLGTLGEDICNTDRTPRVRCAAGRGADFRPPNRRILSNKSLQPEGMSLNTPSGQVRKLWLLYALFSLVCLLLFLQPVGTVAQLCLTNENASHIALIPLISGWLLLTDPRKLSTPDRFDFTTSLIAFVPAVLVALLCWRWSNLNPSTRLAGYILALFLALTGGFAAIWGRAQLKKLWFPFAFLLFAVPLPDFLLSRIIYALQAGSAAITESIFDLTGVPALRQGFVFHLPRVNIEIAQECSGIRSSIALLILAVLVSHFAFRPFWKKAVFVCAGLAMMVIKNGIRIATLTLLAIYVDPGFLFGKLHRQGGFLFFLLGLALLLPVFWLLRRGEKTPKLGTPSVQGKSREAN
jgi:exosortase